MCTAYVLLGAAMKPAVENCGAQNVKTAVLTVCSLATWFSVYKWFGGIGAVDSHGLNHIVPDTVCALSGSLAVIFLSKMLPQAKRKLRLLAYIGQNSLTYYGVQAVMVGVLNTILWHFFDDLYNWRGVLLSLVSLSISVACDTVFCLFYNKYIAPRL